MILCHLKPASAHGSLLILGILFKYKMLLYRRDLYSNLEVERGSQKKGGLHETEEVRVIQAETAEF